MKYLSLIILFSIGLFACKTDDPIQIPVCIDEEIPVFAQFACLGSGDLTVWSFAGQDVFCFNEGSCKTEMILGKLVNIGQNYIYDANCNLICTLGGISGNTLCDGLEWESNAEYLELVYVY